MNREMLGIGVPDALGTDRERALTATEDHLPTDLGTQQGALHGITQRTGARITAIRIKGAGTTYHLAKTTRYPRGLASPRIAHIGRILADEAEIQHLTQRIHVCSLIGLAEAELLRRGIATCEEMRGVATRAITPLTGGTKVDYDRFPLSHDHVARLEIAVDQRRLKRPMQQFHSVAEPGHDQGGSRLASSERGDELHDRAARDVLHDHSQLIALNTQLNQPGNSSTTFPCALLIP